MCRIAREPRPQDAADDASDVFFDLPGDEVLRLLEPPVLPGPPGGGEGGATAIGLMEASASIGGAAGIADFFGGIGAAARRLLNYVTYYQMKERAGKVGARGLNPLLRQIKTANPEVSVHLVGHSFGGRLVAELAKQSPDRVERAVLLDPAMHVDPAICTERAVGLCGDTSFASPDEAIDTRLGDGSLVSTPRSTLEEEAAMHLEQGEDGRWRWRFSPPAVIAAWSEMAIEPSGNGA